MGAQATAPETVPARADDSVHQVSRFIALALGTRFEMRYVNEARWWPASADDVASALVARHADLAECLDRMLEGEEFGSRLTRYRAFPRTPRRSG